MNAIGKFPIYEADQVLSAEHLNQSLGYLEKQDRLSRRMLHGIGIVCGFDFRVSGGTLKIDKGVGITSEGYLIHSETAMVLTQVRKYTPPYPPKYNKFYTPSNQPFQLWEAVDVDEAEGENLQPLADFNLTDKALLLYLEAKDKDLKECIGDDCDNNGTVREFTIRPIFIRLDDLVKIFNKGGKSIEDIAENVWAKYTLSDIIPPRFDVTPANIKTVEHINEAYAALCDTLLPELKEGLNKVEALYADALGLPKWMEEKLKELTTLLGAASKEEVGLQYFFDHMCDIAAAYNELAQVATQWMVACLPDPDEFPMHLALGEMQEIKANAPKIFRNYFKHAPTTPDAHKQQKHVLFLYKRLLKIIGNFKLQEEKEIKATPSSYGVELSQKAIPYYYRPDNKSDLSWLLSWSFEKRERGAWRKIGHYFNEPNKRLQRDLEFNNFYRIEGHLGQDYKQALAGIQNNVNNYRLPVSVLALSTGSVPFNLDLLEECKISDLEADFENAKNSLYCQMQEISCFFGGLPSLVKQERALAEESSGANFAAAASHETPADAEGVFAISHNIKETSGIKGNIARYQLLAQKESSTYTKSRFIASRCAIKPNTIGAQYVELMRSEELQNASLLDLYFPYLNLSNMSAGQRAVWLLYIFPILILDEIEEMAGILDGATISELDFRLLEAFAAEFSAFVKLYVYEINRLEKELDFSVPPVLHDVKHRLVHVLQLCKLKDLYSVYKSYRLRIREALEKLRFSNFIKKHPGIDHKAGAPRGGTFIIVYHTDEKSYRPAASLKEIESERLKVATSETMFEEVKHANPRYRMAANAKGMSISKVSEHEAKAWMEQNLSKFASMTGRNVSPELLSRFRDILNLDISREPKETTLAEGTVIADFYLPYICCSCGGMEITIKEEKTPLTLSLPKSRICIGDGSEFRFTATPEGGEVTGTGVEKRESAFFFNAKSTDLKVGQATFTYTLDGQSVQLTISLLEKPTAGFEAFPSLTPNGVFVSFENTSFGAKQFAWDFGNGSTSTEENPKEQFYKIGTEEVVISLKVSNGVCEDEDVQTVPISTKEYELIIGEGATDFCSNDGEQPIIINIKGVGEEPFPFAGIVTGKGVLAPSGSNKRYRFNPGRAGVGTHQIVYKIDGLEAAILTVKVTKGFDAKFEVKISSSSDGVMAHIFNIEPADLKAYSWRFDTDKPTEIEQRTNAVDFTHFYSLEDVKGRDEIKIELTIQNPPCIASKVVSFDVPAENVQPKPGTFVVTDVENRITGNISGLSIGSTLVLTHRTVSSPTNNAASLLTSVGSALNKAATRKKLLNGNQNSTLSKQFSEVLTGLQKHYNSNRARLSPKQKASLMKYYTAVAELEIDFIGLLEKDLKPRESLHKSFVLMGKQTIALKSALGATNTARLKNRLNALGGLNKPLAASIAQEIGANL